MNEYFSKVVIFLTFLLVAFFIFAAFYFHTKFVNKKRCKFAETLVPGDVIRILNPDFLSDYHYINIIFVRLIEDSQNKKHIEYIEEGEIKCVPLDYLCVN